ncbi:hypothetical protein [Pseudofulvibacter geojedonensis]|uniref:Lipoprotein n=1 Tax=Pseudofulvibacter geojedonensis TaxID=1123758 RepID=A0ABW3HYQ1_9FLAO
MNLRKAILTGVLFLLVANVFATGKNSNIDRKNVDRKACKYVQEQIDLIEKFHSLEEGYSLELVFASKFLGEISNLKSEWKYSCLADEPTSDIDVKTWKNWYNDNKHNLYWDAQLKTVRMR